MAEDSERLDLTVEETARVLKLHQETIRIWLRGGKYFPHAYRLPGRAGWRIPQADIDALKKEAA